MQIAKAALILLSQFHFEAVTHKDKQGAPPFPSPPFPDPDARAKRLISLHECSASSEL
jgi:hypothetical protein